jgi:predicted nuclease of predicted toxin-antitoxin system
MSPLKGFPPKVIWLAIGNCTTKEIEDILRRNQDKILQFDTDDSAGTLLLGPN